MDTGREDQLQLPNSLIGNHIFVQATIVLQSDATLELELPVRSQLLRNLDSQNHWHSLSASQAISSSAKISLQGLGEADSSLAYSTEPPPSSQVNLYPSHSETSTTTMRQSYHFLSALNSNLSTKPSSCSFHLLYPNLHLSDSLRPLVAYNSPVATDMAASYKRLAHISWATAYAAHVAFGDDCSACALNS